MSLAVIGTSTDIGKTIVSALVLRRYGHRARLSYWKPIATGAADGRDAETVSRLASDVATILPEHYLFAPPVSPHLAARRSRREIRVDVIVDAWTSHCETDPERQVVVEGVGGLLVPLDSRGTLLADLLVALALPCLLVASSQLGTINHTLLTLEAMRSRELQLLGVVLNGPKNRDNRQAIERFGSAPVLGEVERLPRVSRAALDVAARSFDRDLVLESALVHKAASPVRQERARGRHA